jgi:hypothetical protein
MSSSRLAAFGLAMLAISACGAPDECTVPDQSCATEKGFYRVCNTFMGADLSFQATRSVYYTYECPGIEPACRSVGTRDHVCEDAKPPEPCGATRSVLMPQMGSRTDLIDVADVDGDHRLDLLLGCNGEGVEYCGLWSSIQTEDGSFTSPRELGAYGGRFREQRSGDLDGDGSLDFVVDSGPPCCDPDYRNMPHSLDVILGGGNSDFKPITSYTLDRWDRLAAVHDLDADGRAEILVMRSDAVVVLSYSAQKVTEQLRVPVLNSLGDTPVDGVTGVLVIDVEGTSRPYLGVEVDGSYQTFRPDGQAYALALDAVRFFTDRVAFADFDRDGAADLLSVSSYDGKRPTVEVLTSNRDGSSFTTHQGRTLPYEDSAILAGDVDGDGILDAVVLHKNARMSVALGDGSGELKPPHTFLLDHGVEEDRFGEVFLADMDGDGQADLVEATAAPTTLSAPEPGPATVRVTSHACL